MPIESVVWNEWYPVAVADELVHGTGYRTQVLGHEIEFGVDASEVFSARRCDAEQTPCRVRTGYRMVWIALGDPGEKWFELPEFSEPGRRIVALGSLRMHVSGLRVVENFLDMAHFPYVHGGLLGQVPHTEVKPYRVVVDNDNDEIFAHDCVFYQPVASAAATGGIDAQYTYRVVRPLSTMLYKSSVSDLARRDIICLFVQPLSEERCIGHFLLACIDEVNTDSQLRLFQQTIVGQDLTILANHLPRTLPLDSGFETPTRADAMSIAYRRWLREKGVRYGAYCPAATPSVMAPELLNY